MLTIRDVGLDLASLGQMLLVDITPCREFVDGKPTDKVTGYRYFVTLPAKNYKRLGVKIDGEQIMEMPNTVQEVEFTGLDISAYVSGKFIQLSAKATGIALVNKRT